MSNADTRVPHVFGTSYKRGSVVPPATGSTELVVFQDTDGQMKTINAAGTKAGLGGGVTSQWRQQMFAYFRTVLPTLTNDFLIDIDKGNLGDYTTDNVAGTGTQNINTGFNGGVVTLDTAGTAGSTVGIHPIGTPALVANIKTSAPWAVSGRAKLGTGSDGTTQLNAVAMTTSGVPGSSNIILGVRGVVSTAFLTLTVQGGGTTAQVSTQAIDTTQFLDFGISFDGVTLQAHYGDVMAGTFAALTGCLITDLTNVSTSPGTLWALVANGGTAASRTVTEDALWCAYRRS